MKSETLNLLEWENVLLQDIQKIRFLGEKELSREEVHRLGKLIKEKIGNDWSQGINYLEQYTPACLVNFLVAQGIWEYDQGDYWTAIYKELGYFPGYYQTKIGNIFLAFLKKYNLAFPDLDIARKFVTPILIHGGIPQSCLPEFFHKVALYYVFKKKTQNQLIKEHLFAVREEEKRQIEVQKVINDLKNKSDEQKHNLNLFQKYLALIDQYNSLLSDVSSKLPTHVNSLTDITTKIDKLNLTKEQIHNSIRTLEKICYDYESFISLYKEYLVKQEEINELKSYTKQQADSNQASLAKIGTQLFNNWTSEFEDLVSNIDVEELNRLLKELYSIQKARPFKVSNKMVGLISVLALISFGSFIVNPFWGLGLISVIGTSLGIHVFSLHRRKQSYIESLITKIKNVLPGLELTSEVYEKPDHAIDQINQLKAHFQQLRALENTLLEKQLAIAEIKETIQQVSSTYLDMELPEQNLLEECLERNKQLIADQLQEIHKINSELEILKSAHQKLCDVEQQLQGLRQQLVENNINFVNTPSEQVIYQLNKSIEEIEAQLNQKQSHSSLLSYISEPIRYFLIYGEDWAESWLINTVEYINTYLEEGVEPESNLPFRVREALSHWLQDNQLFKEKTKEERISAIRDCFGEKFSTPGITINFEKQKLIVRCESQRFQISPADQSVSISLNVSSATINKNFRISGLYVAPELIETKPLEFEISDWREDLSISLYANGVLVCNWIIRGFVTSYIAFTQSGKLLGYKDLPGEKLWIAMEEGWKLNPSSIVIEESVLSGTNYTYTICLADFSQSTDCAVESLTGDILPLDFAEDLKKPYLKGDKILNAVVNGGPLFTSPPSLFIPSDDYNWKITIQRGTESITPLLALEELPCESVENGYEVKLAEYQLTGQSAGRFIVTVYGPSGERTILGFTIIPDFLLECRPDLLLPWHDVEYMEVSIIAEGVQLEFLSPLEIIEHKDAAYDLKVPVDLEYIEAKIIYRSQNLSAQFPVPKLLWRICDAKGIPLEDWTQHTKEIWLGDWEAGKGANLEIALPKWFQGSATLSSGNKKSEPKVIKDGYVSFDLLPFKEELLLDSPVCVVKLHMNDFSNNRRDEGPLLHARSKWEVFNIQQQELPNGNMKLTWQEAGKATNRVVKLWSLQQPWNTPAIIDIPGGQKELEVGNIPPGRYLAEFDIDDPWAGISDERFPQTPFNAIKIYIKGKDPFIEDWDVKSISDYKMQVYGHCSNLNQDSRVLVLLLGYQEGRAKVWRGRGIVNSSGKFMVEIYSKEKIRPHWVGIFIEPGIYTVGAIPRSCALELSFEQYKKALDLENICGLSLKLIVTKNNRNSVYTLSEQDKKSIILAVSQGHKIKDIIVNKIIKVNINEGKVIVGVEKGVRCLTCEKIFPSVQDWNIHTGLSSGSSCSKNPRRSLEVNYEPTDARMFWIIKAKEEIKYLMASHILTESHYFPTSSIPKIKELLSLVCNKEEEALRRISNGS